MMTRKSVSQYAFLLRDHVFSDDTLKYQKHVTSTRTCPKYVWREIEAIWIWIHVIYIEDIEFNTKWMGKRKMSLFEIDNTIDRYAEWFSTIKMYRHGVITFVVWWRNHLR